MLCEKCHKNEANISVSTMINGVAKNYHLCSACAEKENLFKKGFEDDLLNNFLGKTFFSFPFDTTIDSLNRDSRERARCSFCGQSLNDFKNTGLFGCPHCYQEFRNLIEPVLDEIHGSHLYLEGQNILERNGPKDTSVNNGQGEQDQGKKDQLQTEPKSDLELAYEKVLLEMKNQLKEYIKQEEYEKAAVQRDQIKEFTFEKYQEQQEKAKGEK